MKNLMHRHQWTFLHSHFCKCDTCGELKDMRTKFTMSDAALITLAALVIFGMVFLFADDIAVWIWEMML